MRNKYNEQFEKDAIKYSKKYKKKIVKEKLNQKYQINMSENSFNKYCYRHNIKCIDYKKNKIRNVKKHPIGYEYIKPDGMILIKLDNNKWEYKQRYIYEQYYKCKLNSNDFIIFLNQDRTDFSIDNLEKITRKESAIMINNNLFSNDKEITKIGIKIAKIKIKMKEIENGKRTKKINR